MTRHLFLHELLSQWRKGLLICGGMVVAFSVALLFAWMVTDTRVPGVREYSALLEVNANTTVKSYDLLSQRGVIYQKRGMGYFVAADALKLILDARRSHFISNTLPDFIQQLQQLQIPFSEVENAYREATEKKG